MRKYNLMLPLLLTLLMIVTGCRQARVEAGTIGLEPDAAPITATATMSLADAASTALAKTNQEERASNDVQEINELLQREAPRSATPRRPLPPLPRIGKTPSPQVKSLVDLLPTTTPTPLMSETSTDQVARDSSSAFGVVSASRVNLRAGPGTVYAIASQLKRASEFEITGRNEDGSWLQICCPVDQAEQTWISAALVDLRLPVGMALQDVAVAEAPPAPEPVAAAAQAAPAAVGLPGAGGFAAPGATNPLTGQALPAGRSGQRPIIVCVNNDFAARPQFGTSQADVMYEYLMEGYGITRFSAVYYGSESSQIGPVRSARLINYYMGALYDAGLVCSGASDQVRYLLKHQAPFPYLDIDLDDASNTRYSVSIGSDYRSRLRTSTVKLRRWLADWGAEKPASIRGFTFGAAPGGGKTATSIQIPYPNGQAGFRYDSGSGRYLRSMSGGVHVDGNTGAQLALDNVVVQYVPHQATDIVEDSLGSTSIRLDLFGSGPVTVFRDGQAFEGTWRSESQGDTPRFFDASGAEIPLKPGRTWISVAPSSYGVTYQ